MKSLLHGIPLVSACWPTFHADEFPHANRKPIKPNGRSKLYPLSKNQIIPKGSQTEKSCDSQIPCQSQKDATKLMLHHSIMSLVGVSHYFLESTHPPARWVHQLLYVLLVHLKMSRSIGVMHPPKYGLKGGARATPAVDRTIPKPTPSNLHPNHMS